MKKASAILNKVLKEYPNWFICSVGQKTDDGYTTIINGDILVKRYDEYQQLLTDEERYGITIYGSTMEKDTDVGFVLKEGINVNDIDLRIVASFYPENGYFKKAIKRILIPDPTPEKFCTFSNNHCCLIVTIIVLLLIGIGLYILFSEGDEYVQWTNVYKKPVDSSEYVL